MNFEELVNKRYSCKKFSNKPVSRELINKILEIGSKAPTAKNLQEQHIYVIETNEFLSKIDALTPCRYNAPIVLVVAYNKNNVFTYPGEKRDSGIEDASIVATHLMLAAASLGVDSCWLNFFDPEKAKKLLGINEDEEVLMLLDLGYADKGVTPLPNHYSRKDIKDTTTFK